MNRRAAVVMTAVLSAAVSGCGETPPATPQRVSAGQPCDDCGSLRIAHVVPLEEADGHPDRAPDLARRSDDGSIWTVTGTQVYRFDASGAFIGLLRADSADAVDADDGSSEIRSIADLVFIEADSVLIVDSANHRLTVLTTTGRVHRSAQLPAGSRVHAAVPIDWPDRVLVAGHVGARSGVFELSAREDHAVVRRSAFSAQAAQQSERYFVPARFESDIWAVDAASTVSRWDDSGTSRTQSHRGGGRSWLRRRDARSAPRVHDVSVDHSGRIWIYSRIANEQTRPAFRSLEARRAGGTVDIGVEALYHTMVEVLDQTGTRVLARGLIRAWLVSAAGASEAVFRTDGADGHPRTRLYDFELASGGG